MASGLYKTGTIGALFTTENWADSNPELSSDRQLCVYARIQLFPVALGVLNYALLALSTILVLKPCFLTTMKATNNEIKPEL